ncbi:MAG: phenylpropionate dioxygenase-like ring-hydroxylating dioxygenase large terminal subunit, partial [Gammaproteobacteria bacterium]
MNDVTKDLLDETQGYVEQAKAKAAKSKKPWQTWIDAEWGFRNHWYPASLGRHVNEGEAIGIELLGEEILVTRQNGKIHALENRCPH